jgi:hypothetical protein
MSVKANLIINQGTDFITTVTVTDDAGNIVDMTGYTAHGQIRKHYSSETAYDIICSFDADRTNGAVYLEVYRETTAAMEAGRYVYDVEMTSSQDVRTRLIEGIVTVTPQVTRSND